MEKPYEIGFAEENEYIILTEESLNNIVFAMQKEHSGCMKVNIEMLLPAGYAKFIAQMINANREHEMFAYHYLHKEKVDVNDILLILRRQISLLSIHGIRCFTEVSFGKHKGWIYYFMKINPDAAGLLKKGKNLLIGNYNQSEDESGTVREYSET